MAGEIHFMDADCYARMTRARLCFEHLGTVVRWHHFENFPDGTSPHTTAPFDYLIVFVAELLRPLTRQALDLSGAIISPLIAVALGCFIWWWSIKLQLPFRCPLLFLYAASPILVHGTALGRPDHQSLLIALIAVGLCAEWQLARKPASAWTICSGLTWSMAIWVSCYEPLIVLLLVVMLRRRRIFQTERLRGWIIFILVLVIALIIERRLPHWPFGLSPAALANWSSTIGELVHVPLVSMTWLYWCGGFILLVPLLFAGRREKTPLFLAVVLLATFVLTLWQARWAYFFTLTLMLLVPGLLSALPEPRLAWAVAVMAFVPILIGWDRQFSPAMAERRAENALELVEMHAIGRQINGPFIAPWWFSPALSYQSAQPAIAGSSHEAISGILDSARFYLATDAHEAQLICQNRAAQWIVSYDADRLGENCGGILQQTVSSNALCNILDRTPTRTPKFLQFVTQTARFKLYRVRKI